MSHLQVRLEDDRSAFRPRTELRGSASWNLDAAARKIELRLCWFTQGIGIAEADIIETVSVERPDRDGRQSFTFRLPESPLSYTGALSGLWWAVELVVLPSEECAHTVFCLSHVGHPISLVPVPDSASDL